MADNDDDKPDSGVEVDAGGSRPPQVALAAAAGGFIGAVVGAIVAGMVAGS